MMIHDFSVYQITIDWDSNAGCEKTTTPSYHTMSLLLYYMCMPSMCLVGSDKFTGGLGFDSLTSGTAYEEITADYFACQCRAKELVHGWVYPDACASICHPSMYMNPMNESG